MQSGICFRDIISGRMLITHEVRGSRDGVRGNFYKYFSHIGVTFSCFQY